MAEKAGYKHFMLKEIFEQPTAARETILGRVSQDSGKVFLEEMKITDAQLRAVDEGHDPRVRHVVARRPGRQVHDRDAGAGPGRSRLRHRSSATASRSSAPTRSPSSSRSRAKRPTRWPRCARPSARAPRASASATSSAAWSTRETDGTIYTHAGPEIGVASTKAFTSQLVALYLLALRLGQVRGTLSPEASKPHIDALLQLPQLLEETLEGGAGGRGGRGALPRTADFLYLGRGINYPIALEGALKLKEISYIHAEGYPAGEMKHGPIALIDEHMPVVTIAPHDHVFEKMIGNMQEAKARGGSIIALTTRGDNKLGGDSRPHARRRARGPARRPTCWCRS